MNLDKLKQQVSEDRRMLTNLANMRKRQGLDENIVARKLGLTAEEFKKMEQGFADPTLKQLRKLANLLNVKIEYVITENNDLKED